MLLFLLAYILFLPISILNYLYVVLWRGKSSKGYFRQSAVDFDRYGNSELRSIFNAALIKKNGYQFGDFRETISSVLGKNERDGTLSRLGKALVWFLDKLDPGHCKKSIFEL